MPNVLDENVVILKFDNSDFKKNTEDSVKSLENLKSSLQNADSGETLSKLGSAAKTIDLSGVTQSIDTVNKRFSLMGVVGMSAINKLTSTAMSSVGNLMKAVPNQLIQGGWKRALNIEQASFLMKGLGYEFEGTYDKITKKFEGVKGAVLAAVDDTAYGLDEAAKVAATFMASGITDIETLANKLKAVSGVAAVTSTEYSRVGRIFAQVAGQGRMMGDDLNQLSDMGFNAAQEIVKYLNANKGVKDSALEAAIAAGHQVKAMKEIQTHAKLTEADVRDMVSAGAISFEIMSSSLEHFFDTAQEANKTYSGSFANVKAALSRMGAQLEEPKLKNMTRIFNTLLPILKQLESFIEPVTKKIAAASNKITDFINEGILNPLATAIGVDPSKLFHGFGEAVKKAGDESEIAGDKTKTLGDKIKVTTKEWQAALDIWNKGTYGTGQKRADAIRELGMSYEHVQGIINKFYKKGFDWEKTKADYIVGSEKEKKQNEETGKAVEEATDRIYEQTQQLSTLGKVIKGVVNFAKAFINTFNAIKTTIHAAWKASKSFLSTMGGGLSSIFLRISEVVLGASKKLLLFAQALDGDKKAFADLFNYSPKLFAVFSGLQSIANGLRKAFTTVSDTVKEFLNSVKSSGALESFKSSINNLVNKIFVKFVSYIKKISDGFKSLFKTFTGNGIGSSIASVFSSMLNGISNFIKGLTSGEKVAGSFMSAIGAMANGIVSTFAPVVDWLIGHFFSALQSLIEFFTELGQSEGVKALKQAFTDLFDSLSKAEGPLDNVVSGLGKLSNSTNTGGLDKVVNFFSNIAKGLADFINAVARGESPLEKFVGVFKKVKNSLSVGGVVDYLKNTIGYTAGQDLIYTFNGLIHLVDSFSEWLIKIGALEGLTKAAKTVIAGIGSICDYFKNVDWNGLFKTVKGYDWEKISKVILSLTGAFAIFKTAMDFGKVAKSAAGMFSSIGKMFKSIAGIGEAIKQSIKASTFAILAVSIAILIGAIVALAMVPADKSRQALTTVGIIMASLAAIVAATTAKNFNPAALQSVAIAFVGVGAGVMLIATSMMMIARLKPSEIIKAGVVIGAFMVILALISRHVKEMAGAGTAFLGLAVALNLLVTAVMAFALMPIGMLLKGGAAIFGFMVMLSAAAKIADSSKPGGFLAMAVALNLLVPALILMALIPTDMLIKGGTAVVALMLAMAKAANIAGGSDFANLGKMAVVIGVLAASALVLSFIDPGRLAVATAGISAMMLSLGYAGKGAAEATKGILAFALVIGVLAGALIALDKLAPETAAKNAIAMAALIAAIGGVLAVFGKLKVSISAAAQAAVAFDVALGIIVGGIAAIIAILAAIKRLSDKMAEHFGGKAGATKRFMEDGIDFIGWIGEAIGTFFGRMDGAYLQNAPSKTEQFIELVNGLGDLFNVVEKLGPKKMALFAQFAAALNDLAGANMKESIGTFMSSFGGGQTESISTAIGDFVKGLNKLVEGTKDLDKGDMAKAQAAADVFRTFTKGMSEMSATSGLSTIWSNKQLGGFGGFSSQMVDFGKDMKKFIDAMDDVDLTKLKALFHGGKNSKISLIMQTISTLANADVPEKGLKKLITGFKSLKGFGEEMTGFGASMILFIHEMDQCKLDKLQGLINSGKLAIIISVVSQLNELGKALNPSGGWKQFKEGNTTLGEFMADLGGFDGFAANLQTFVGQMQGVRTDNLQDIVDNKLKPIESIVTSLSTIAELIPESGGWVQLMDGKQDLGVFGSQLAQFAIGFDTFATETAGMEFGDDFGDKVQKICDAATILNGIQPPEQTFIEAVTAWAKQDLQFDGINKLLAIVKYINDEFPPEVDISTKATQLGIACQELTKIKPVDTGFFEAIAMWAKSKVSNLGIMNMARTIVTINAMAPAEDPTPKIVALATASEHLGRIRLPNEGFFEAIKRWATEKVQSAGITNLVKTIKAVNEASVDVKTDNIARISTAASHVRSFVSKIQGLGDIPTGANLVTLAKNVGKFASRLNSTKTEGLAEKAQGVTAGVQELKKASSTKVDMSGSGASAGASLSKGISSSKGSITSAVSSLMNAAKGAVKTNILYNPGKNVSQGLANGMKSMLSSIRAASSAIVAEVEKAVRAKAKMKSPSRLMMMLGGYIGEGFAIGIQGYSRQVYKASASMASESIKAANEAMDSLDTFVNPVITPVLDLTEIQSGAQQLNALVSQNEALSVSANVNASASSYATPWLVNQMLDRFDEMTNKSLDVTVKNDDVGATNYFNFNVDGAENPEDFADRVARRLEIKTRSM